MRNNIRKQILKRKQELSEIRRIISKHQDEDEQNARDNIINCERTERLEIGRKMRQGNINNTCELINTLRSILESEGIVTIKPNRINSNSSSNPSPSPNCRNKRKEKFESSNNITIINNNNNIFIYDTTHFTDTKELLKETLDNYSEKIKKLCDDSYIYSTHRCETYYYDGMNYYVVRCIGDKKTLYSIKLNGIYYYTFILDKEIDWVCFRETYEFIT